MMKKVEHIKIKENMLSKELVEGMKNIGFGARKIGKASEIMKKMFLDSECKVFFGAAGAMVPGGMREVFIDILENVDVFVCTGATLTHDLVEALEDSHYLIDQPFETLLT